MRHTKAMLLILAVLLCGALSAAALSDGPLKALWNSGCDLLFHTDNVTVTGEATFTLDGEIFKIAQLNYVQDGVNSLYDLKLTTPRPGKDDRHSGWTIITDHDGENVYVIEAVYPDIYHAGTTNPCASLLRRTAQLDALTDLGGLVAGQVEPLLPEGIVTAEDTEAGRVIRLAVSRDQVPDLAQSALNLAAQYFTDRWFHASYEHDVLESPFADYTTPAEALTWGTQRWDLRDADVSFTLDAQGRISAAQGTVTVESTYWNGEIREVKISFTAAVSAYGESSVAPFDPEAYGVMLPWDYYAENYGDEIGEYEGPAFSDEEWERWMQRADAILAAQGYEPSETMDYSGWQVESGVEMDLEDGDAWFYMYFDTEGGLRTFWDVTEAWQEADEKDVADVQEGDVEKALAFLKAFLADQNPALADALPQLTLTRLLGDDQGNAYLVLQDEPDYSWYVAIQTAPTLRIRNFTYWAPEELYTEQPEGEME